MNFARERAAGGLDFALELVRAGRGVDDHFLRPGLVGGYDSAVLDVHAEAAARLRPYAQAEAALERAALHALQEAYAGLPLCGEVEVDGGLAGGVGG